MILKGNQWFSRTAARGKVKQWIKTAGERSRWGGEGSREVLRGAERQLRGMPS
mgnify:CR=1 FL=1